MKEWILLVSDKNSTVSKLKNHFHSREDSNIKFCYSCLATGYTSLYLCFSISSPFSVFCIAHAQVTAEMPTFFAVFPCIYSYVCRHEVQHNVTHMLSGSLLLFNFKEFLVWFKICMAIALAVIINCVGPICSHHFLQQIWCLSFHKLQAM